MLLYSCILQLNSDDVLNNTILNQHLYYIKISIDEPVHIWKKCIRQRTFIIITLAVFTSILDIL